MSLVRYEAARTALAEAHRVDEAAQSFSVKSDRHLALDREFPPTCPPCTGNCMQGRTCDSWCRRPVARPPASFSARARRWVRAAFLDFRGFR